MFGKGDGAAPQGDFSSAGFVEEASAVREENRCDPHEYLANQSGLKALSADRCAEHVEILLRAGRGTGASIERGGLIRRLATG